MAFTTFQLETPALASGVWELARPAEFSDDVQPDHANFSDVSCTSPGNCTAVGNFENSDGDGYQEAFTMTMTDGEWETARPAEFGEGIHKTKHLMQVSNQCHAPHKETAPPSDTSITAPATTRHSP